MTKHWWSYSTMVTSSVGIPTADGDRARMGSRARFRVSWRLLVIFLAMKFITVPIAIAVCTALAGSARAETVATAVDAPVDDAKVLVKNVTGKVVSMTKRNLSLEYETKTSASEVEISEMLLPFGKEMAFERLTKPSDLKPGDTINVRIKQRYHEDDKGTPVLLSTEIVSIALMKNGPEGLQSTR